MESHARSYRNIITIAIMFISMLMSFPSLSSAKAVTVKRVVITKYRIPCLICYDKKVKKGPMALVIHWMGGKKEDVKDIGESLAEKGFFAVLPDLAGYGERIAFGPPANSSFIPFLVDSAKEFTAIIDSYKKDPRVNTSRVGMTGISLGGILTYMYCTVNKHVTAAAPMAGSPDWQWFTYGIGSDTYALSALNEWEPLRHLDRFYPCALLMLHGTEDKNVPIQGARSLAVRLRPYYSHAPGKLLLREYKGVGHSVTEDMKREAVGWLAMWTK